MPSVTPLGHQRSFLDAAPSPKLAVNDSIPMVTMKTNLDAKRISDMIDQQLRAEEAALRKERETVIRVLLLGQSESGKSTTLKNFRMAYDPREWAQERISWRTVIQLNLVQNVLTILDTLAEYTDEGLERPPTSASFDSFSTSESSSSISRDQSGIVRPTEIAFQFTSTHGSLYNQLTSLRKVAIELKRVLGSGTDEITSMRSEHYLGASKWRDIIERHDIEHTEGLDHVMGSIAACRDDMRSLWKDEEIHKLLKMRNIDLVNASGFFLDDLDRIATTDYEPSDDDIVRARLRTLGVQEHRIKFERDATTDLGARKQWVIYDVGGSRTVRRAWIPYFENIDALIFSISCFDENLLEDRTVNRLEDSLQIWRAINCSKMLTRTSFILFLNKYDLLKRKLRQGISVKAYWPEYGDQPTDPNAVMKFFRTKFKMVEKYVTPKAKDQGSTYIYVTTVTDTKATAVLLTTVTDSLFRHHLKASSLL